MAGSLPRVVVSGTEVLSSDVVGDVLMLFVSVSVPGREEMDTVRTSEKGRPR